MNIDTRSRQWLEIAAWAEERLARHRQFIDSPHTDPARTQVLRGQIMELKALLALPNDQQADLIQIDRPPD